MRLLADLWSWIADRPISVLVVAWVLLSVGIAARWIIVQRRRTAEELAKSAGHKGPLPPLYIERSDRNEQFAIGGDFRSDEEIQAEGALEIEAGRLAYQIPEEMWRDTPETVEIRLGRQEAQGMMLGFVGTGEVKAEDTPIVETMTVHLWSIDDGAFLIQRKLSDAQQLVKRDRIKGTALQGDDFARWQWLVTPKQTGLWKLFVTVSAGLTDSRGVPVTTSLPSKTFPVTVRVHIVRATVAAIGLVIPAFAWVIVTTLIGIFTRDYWWPFVRDIIGLG